MILEDTDPRLDVLPPRLPRGHVANLLRAEIFSAQPLAHKRALTREWWARYGEVLAEFQKRWGAAGGRRRFERDRARTRDSP